MRPLAVAEQAAREAAQILVNAMGQVEAREKAPSDLVTDADLASQDAITRIIRDAFPDHAILAEEGQDRPEDRPHRWIVDPLDGTVNFAHGLPIWCVSIGFEVGGQLECGVISAPLLGQTFVASRGEGAWLNGVRINVSGANTLRSSLISTGMPTDFTADADRQLHWFRGFSSDTHSVRRTGSSAWNLAMVAAGGFEVFYASSLHPWDAAAGVLLVQEAGGTVSDLEGAPYRLDFPGLLASNGHVHDESLRVLRSFRGPT